MKSLFFLVEKQSSSSADWHHGAGSDNAEDHVSIEISFSFASTYLERKKDALDFSVQYVHDEDNGQTSSFSCKVVLKLLKVKPRH